MGITPHQAKYFAYELTKQSPSNTVDKFASTLANVQATVDLNPHQIDAALFAFRSPLSKGAVLADEVGLGKTVEAGILLAQKWAERKRNLLVIVPATLRKQWSQELADKFFIPSTILEKKSFDQQIKTGNLNPFHQKDSVVICSYQFVRSKDAYVKQMKWDLVIIDEAHRLRNVYKPTNKVGNAIKDAISNAPKILLTATPLQNSLLELYGLVSIIDEHTFGDLKSFKEQFVGIQDSENFQALKDRLKTICQRTLRRQVLEYINYTNRIPLTQEFYPTADEQKLYDLISDYLQREKMYALPNAQRKLMTLILRKLLASSTFAISGTLDALSQRLQDLEDAQKQFNDPIEVEALAPDLETSDEIEEEWDDDGETEEFIPLTPIQREELRHEKALIDEFRNLAVSIQKNSKGEVLLQALKKGFVKLKELGAAQKAVIFTESTRTQQYLLKILEESEYKGKVILFNGSNSDPRSKEIYKNWLQRYQGTDKTTGSPSSDMRAALVEYFKNEAVILIATEAAAEGINLQFCSLIANYDLPWNPQRIEQRIGRCHRYGQKHDVVVINFLNKSNAADQRVYELLDQKFRLFDGVFGASDEVLGTLESGLDFEKKIAEIYQKCRSPEQIEFEFNALQRELEENISARLSDTKRKLLENFDEEVQEKLKIGKLKAEEALSRHEAWLWQITRYYLSDYAEFKDEEDNFTLIKNPFPEEAIHPGPYRTGKDVEDANLYRVGHPLAQRVIETCKQVDLKFGTITFDLTRSNRNLSALTSLIGKNGYIVATKLQINGFETQDYVFIDAQDEEDNQIDDEIISKMLTLNGVFEACPDELMPNSLKERIYKKIEAFKHDSSKRDSEFFDEENDKLDLWADDKRASFKAQLKEADDKLKELKKLVKNSSSMPEKLTIQKQIRTLEKEREESWRKYDLESKEIEKKKDSFIDNLEKKMTQSSNIDQIFFIKWKLK
jgi:ERCC4-related helicase